LPQPPIAGGVLERLAQVPEEVAEDGKIIRL
jgi:hypothetical protein